MKSQKDFKAFDRDDTLKKPTKLEPVRKGGKERHAFLDDDDDLDGEPDYRGKRESILDYFDEEED